MAKRILKKDYEFKQETDLPKLCEEFYDGNWCLFYTDLNRRINKNPADNRRNTVVQDDMKYIKENFISNLSDEEFYKQLVETVKAHKLGDTLFMLDSVSEESHLYELVNLYFKRILP